MKTLLATAVLGTILLGLQPAAALTDRTSRVLEKVKAELKTPASVTLDSHHRLSINWTRGTAKAGDIAALPGSILAKVRPILWKNRDFRILETKTESSRFGVVANSTLSLDGFPVIDHFMRVATRADGSLKDVVLSIPADAAGFAVADAKPAVSLDAAGRTICAHASEMFDGLICPGQAQRVWFMDENGILAPGARMLLKGAEMSRLFEAIVDLRTGVIVRFADIARR